MQKRWKALIARLGLALSMGFAACRPDPSDPRNQAAPRDRPNATPPPTQNQENLSTLGYVDYSPDADETTDGKLDAPAQERSSGYNLYTLLTLRRAELVDGAGHVVHAWQDDRDGAEWRWARSVLLPGGDLLVIGSKPDNDAKRIEDLYQGFVMRLNWNGERLWRKKIGEAHHDISLMPDGRLLLLGFQIRRIPSWSETDTIKDDRVLMLSPEGEILEHRSLYDMLSAKPELYSFTDVEPGPFCIDPFHANSVRWIGRDSAVSASPVDGPDRIIVCMRHQNAVAVFDWGKGEVIWAWGQDQLSGPHDASVLLNGHVLVFDNGLDTQRSRVLEIDPVTNAIVWEYPGDGGRKFFSAARGSCQRLPNGHTLIGDSNHGRGFEVNPEGRIVWEYRVPHQDRRGHCVAINRFYRIDETWLMDLLKENSIDGVE